MLLAARVTDVALAVRETKAPAAATSAKKWRLRELVLTGLLVALTAVPFLASPRIPPELEGPSCVRVVDLPGPLHLTLNCDSEEFLIVGQDPRLLLTLEHRVRQGRPLYPVIGWALAQPLHALGVAKLGRRVMGDGGATLPEYAAYVLLNWLLLIGAVGLLRRLVAARSYFEPRALLPVAVILVNEVTKAFFWTPHLQILNLFITVASLSLLVWMQERAPMITWWRAGGIGLALGVGSLAYGGFAVTAGAVALGLLFLDRDRNLLQRVTAAVPTIAALFIGFALPIAAWTSFVIARTGSFYSHEVEVFRQFVWMADSWARGPGALGADLLRNLAAYARTAAMVGAFTVAALVVVRVTASALRVAAEPSAREVMVRRAVLWYLVANVPFYALMGYYQRRLTWTIVPPLLVLLGYEVGNLEAALKGRGRALLAGSLAVVAACYVVYWIVRPGPYS